MPGMETFSPGDLVEDAKRSGFLQCPRCGLVWFGRQDIESCPEPTHGKPVHVAVLCRTCDTVVPVERLAAHLSSGVHVLGCKQRVAR